MGQEQSGDSNPTFPDTIQKQHLERRFVISSHPLYRTHPQFKLLHQRLTQKQYILRIITSNNQQQNALIQTLILKKLTNKNQSLVKPEFYQPQTIDNYCSTTARYFLFYNVNEWKTLREAIVQHRTDRVPFKEDQILAGMENLVGGLMWLRYFNEIHGNINSMTVYYKEGKMMLSDPFMAPQSVEVPDRYPSPEKLLKITNQLDDYDPYISDLFSICLTMLQLVTQNNLERVYKRNHTINHGVLIEEVNKCTQYPVLMDLLRYLLLGDHINRQNYLREFSQKFDREIEGSEGTVKTSRVTRKLGAFAKKKTQRSQSQASKQTETVIEHLNFNKRGYNFGGVDLPEHNPNVKPVIDASLAGLSPSIPVNRQAVNSFQAPTVYSRQIPPTSKAPFIRRPLTAHEEDFPKNAPVQRLNFDSPLKDRRPLIVFNPPPLQFPSYSSSVTSEYRPPQLPSLKPPSSSSTYQLNTRSTEPLMNQRLSSEAPGSTSTAFPIAQASYPSKQEWQRFRLQDNPTFKLKASNDFIDSAKANHILGRGAEGSTPDYIKKSKDFNSSSGLMQEHYKEMDSRINKFELEVSEAIRQSIQSLHLNSNPSLGIQQEPPLLGVKTAESVVTMSAQPALDQKPERSKDTHIGEEPRVLTSLVESRQNELDQPVSQPSDVYRQPKNIIVTPEKAYHSSREFYKNHTIPEAQHQEEDSCEGSPQVPKGEYREQTYQNGGVYKGYVFNGKRNGQGAFYYKDGGYYTGQWRENMMNGWGKLYYDSGELAYEGQWYNDEFHGRGKVYNDSSEEMAEPLPYKTFEGSDRFWESYQGELAHDIKSGHGKWTFSNGEYYHGQFVKDMPHGKGTFHSKDGSITGMWSRGQLVKTIHM